MSSVQSPGPEARSIHPIETRAEDQSLSTETKPTHPIAGETSAEEQSLDPTHALHQVQRTEHPLLTPATSPLLSPGQEEEIAHNSGCINAIGLSPMKSAVRKHFNDTIVSDQAEAKAHQNSRLPSPAPSSVTLVPSNDEFVGEHAKTAIDAAGTVVGSTAQLQQANKKRRNKKGKRKAKSKAVKSLEFHHNAGHGETVELEIQIATINPEHPEPSKDLVPRLEEPPLEPSSISPEAYESNQGEWTPVGDSYALFTPKTGPTTFHARTPQIDRYLRQQERLLAARADTRERQKQIKARNQTRKARQILLRRDHITTDSPLLRAMERPRSNVKTQVKSKSPSQSLNEEVVQTLLGDYHQMEAHKRKIQGQIRQCERAIEKQRSIGIKDSSEHVLELPDNAKCKAEQRLGPESSHQDHYFSFDTGTSDDDSSIDSLTQELSESITAEDSGDQRDEACWTESVDRISKSPGLSPKLKKGIPRFCRIESLSSQTSEAQKSTEDNPCVLSEGPVHTSMPELGRPASASLVSQGEQGDGIQIFITNTAENRDSEGSAPSAKSLTDRMLDGGRDPGDVVDSQSSNPYYEVCPDHGPNSQPISHPRNKENCFVSPDVPISCHMPCQGPQSQGSHNEDHPEPGQYSAGTIASEGAERALETVEPLLKSDEHPNWMGGRRGRRSRRGRGYSSNRGDDVLAQSSYRDNYDGGRASKGSHRIQQADNS